MSNESNDTVYVLFESDYHLLFCGVFSSERAACEHVLHHDQYGGYVIKAVDINTNNENEASDGTKEFLRWIDCESYDDTLFDHMSYAEAMRITELRALAKFHEVFGE